MEHFFPTCELTVYSTRMRSHISGLCQGAGNAESPEWGNEKQGHAQISDDQWPWLNVSIAVTANGLLILEECV